MQNIQTAGQSPRHQFQFWHDVVMRSYAACDAASQTAFGFDAEIEIASFSGHELTSVKAQPSRFTRTERHVRSDDDDDMFFSICLSGAHRFRQNDRVLELASGDLLIYDNAHPYEFDYPEPYSVALIRVARPQMNCRFLNVSDIGGTVVRANNPAARLCSDVMSNLITMARADMLSLSILTPALDLIMCSVAKAIDTDTRTTSGRESRLHQIKRFMAEHVADEDLTLERISQEQNMSVRSISRLFAEEGTTPMFWFQQRRLASAYALLAEKRSRSVTDAAFECGFKDLSHFGRSFKKAYGVSPRNILTRESCRQ